MESTYLLYQATKNPFYLHVGRDIIHSLNNHTRCYRVIFRIADPDPGSIGSMDLDPGGQNDQKFHVLECWMFWELKASFVVLFFLAVNVFQFLVVKTLDPDRYSAQNAESGSVSNEYVSTILVFWIHLSTTFLFFFILVKWVRYI